MTTDKNSWTLYKDKQLFKICILLDLMYQKFKIKEKKLKTDINRKRFFFILNIYINIIYSQMNSSFRNVKILFLSKF